MSRRIETHSSSFNNSLRDLLARLRGGRGESAVGRETRTQVERVRTVRKEDLSSILHWVAHPEVRKHLDPAPEVPIDWTNKEEIEKALTSLADYYNNYGEPQKITPIVAVNPAEQIIGVGTIRWRGDPYVPVGKKIASVERLIVSPELQGKGVGTTLLATMVELAFYGSMYRGVGAEQIRLWIMTDDIARPFDGNITFVQKFGFDLLQNSPSWRKYAQDRGIPVTREHAQWYGVKLDAYERQKGKIPYIQPCKTVNFDLTKRTFTGLSS